MKRSMTCMHGKAGSRGVLAEPHCRPIITSEGMLPCNSRLQTTHSA